MGLPKLHHKQPLLRNRTALLKQLPWPFPIQWMSMEHLKLLQYRLTNLLLHLNLNIPFQSHFPLRSGQIPWLSHKVQNPKDMVHLDLHHRDPSTSQDLHPREDHPHRGPSTSLPQSPNTSPDLPLRRSQFTNLNHRSDHLPHRRSPSISLSQSLLVQLTSLGQLHQSLPISPSPLINLLHSRSLLTNHPHQHTSLPHRRNQLTPNLQSNHPNPSQPTLLHQSKRTNPPTPSPHMSNPANLTIPGPKLSQICLKSHPWMSSAKRI